SLWPAARCRKATWRSTSWAAGWPASATPSRPSSISTRPWTCPTTGRSTERPPTSARTPWPSRSGGGCPWCSPTRSVRTARWTSGGEKEFYEKCDGWSYNLHSWLVKKFELPEGGMTVMHFAGNGEYDLQHKTGQITSGRAPSIPSYTSLTKGLFFTFNRSNDP